MVFHTKAGFIGILVFLAVLFVVTMQPVITGQTVYTYTAESATLADYPSPFIKNNYYNDLYIVLGQSHTRDELYAANDVALGLKGYRTRLPEIVSETEVPETAHNLILVGTPCTNSLVALELGTNDCSAFDSKGFVVLNSEERKTTMVVTGKTPQDVRKAALFLRYYNLYAPTGTLAEVTGILENPNGLQIKYMN